VNAPDHQMPPETRWGYIALLAVMESVETVAPDRWSASPKDHSVPQLLVQAADGFLILCGDLAPRNLPSHWDLLRANASLEGLAKFSLSSASLVSLRAEIPAHAESDLSRRLAQVCQAFGHTFSPGRAPQESTIGIAGEAASLDLPKLCEEAGWQCSSRRGDRCAVPLDTRRGAHTALIIGLDGKVQVSTELAAWDSLSQHCREALSAFLLTANARLRLARTIVTEDETGGAAQLEVLFEAPTSAAELNCALEALSVGADLCAPIADILQHPEAAKLFLSVRGGPRDLERMQQTTKMKI
jgi:hypothetical protein